jgi:hypothetical protein
VSEACQWLIVLPVTASAVSLRALPILPLLPMAELEFFDEVFNTSVSTRMKCVFGALNAVRRPQGDREKALALPVSPQVQPTHRRPTHEQIPAGKLSGN